MMATEPIDTLSLSAADTLSGSGIKLLQADSLRSDSLQTAVGLIDSLAADSLRATSVRTPEPIDTADVCAVFGADVTCRTVAVPEEWPGASLPPTARPGYQLAVVGLLLLFVFLFFRMRTEWRRLLRQAWTRDDEECGEEPETLPFGMQAAVVCCGVWMLGVGTMRFALAVAGNGAQAAAEAVGWGVWAVAASLFGIFALQRLLLGAAAALTFSRSRVRRLMALRHAWFASFVLFGTPFVLLAALADQRWAVLFGVCFAVIACVHALGYAIRSFRLFGKLNLSILLWILYLCAVEIMPVGILAVGLLRSWPA